MRSAEHSASGDLGRYKGGPALAPQAPPTPKNRRPAVRCPSPPLSPGRCRRDDQRGARSKHRSSHPQRERYRPAPVAERATLLERAGAGSPAHHRGGQGAGAAGAPRGASRHGRPAPRRPPCAPRAVRLGSLLAADARAPRHPQGHHGDRTHAGSSGLQSRATRQRLRPTGPRRLRSAVPCTHADHDGQAGEGVGGYAGASARAGLRLRPLAAPGTPRLPERHPGPERSMSQGSGQVGAQHPLRANTTRQL
jgi:hypothetical protein